MCAFGGARSPRVRYGSRRSSTVRTILRGFTGFVRAATVPSTSASGPMDLNGLAAGLYLTSVRRPLRRSGWTWPWPAVPARNQLQLIFDELPVPSRQRRLLPLLPYWNLCAQTLTSVTPPSEDSAVAELTSESSHAPTTTTDISPPVVSVVDIAPPARRLTPANQSLRFIETVALAAADPDCLPSRPAVPDLCIVSSHLLSYIDSMPLDQLLCHRVATVNAWPSVDRSHLLAMAHRDLRVAHQNIADLQYYLDGYAAHLSDCAGAWDASIPLMTAETFPRLEGGVRAAQDETAE